MRLVAGVALIAHAFTGSVLALIGGAAGVLLLIGLWTPVAGALVAALELWSAISLPGDFWPPILIATLGLALALLGPGGWSLDARLFGWRRIDVRERNQTGL